MKRILSILLAIVMMLSLVPFATTAFAAGDGDFEFSVYTEGAFVDDYKGTDVNVVVPATYGEYPVVGINMDAFAGKTAIESVTLPEGLTNINYRAFENCSNLATINIPSTVTYIGNDAFAGTKISAITLPDDLDEFDVSGTENITITVNETSKNFKKDGNCIIDKRDNAVIRGYADSVIPSYVKYIAQHSFSDIKNMTEITIPEGVEEIQYNAFANCPDLTTVNVPSTIRLIDYHAFAGDSIDFIDDNGAKYLGTNGNKYALIKYEGSDSTLTLPSETKLIAEEAFYGNDTLTAITLPDGLKAMNYGAFSYCECLKNIVIPESVEDISTWMFNNCSNLETITLNAKVKYIESGFATNCPKLTDVTLPEGLEIICYNALSSNDALKNVNIPTTVKCIQSNAFRYDKSLKKIEIPASCEVLYASAFLDAAVEEFVLDPANKAMTLKDGALVSNYTNALILAIGDNVTIPATVTEIGNGALNLYTGTEIVFPATAKYFDRYIVGGNDKIKTIKILGAEYIAECAFYEMEALETVEIKGNNARIDGRAFMDSNNIKNIKLEGVKAIGESAFEIGSKLESFEIDDTIEELGFIALSCFADSVYTISNNGYYLGNASNPYLILAKAEKSGDLTVNANTKIIGPASCYLKSGDITLPEGVVCICENAFYYFDGNVNIPSTVTYICDSAFYGSKIQNVAIPDGIVVFGDSVFDDCDNVTFETADGINYIGNAQNKYVVAYSMEDASTKEITLKSTTKTVAAKCFEDANLEKITLPDGLVSVNHDAFRYTKLTEIILPDTVKYVAESAFTDNYKATKLKLSSSLEYIGTCAFSSNDMYESVEIPASVKILYSGVFAYTSINELILPDTLEFVASSNIESYAVLESNLPKNTLVSLNTTDDVIAYPDSAITFYAEDINSGSAKLLKSLGHNVLRKVVFEDVPETSWYAQYVNNLAKKGIISGVTDTLYKPKDNLTRAQFVQILAKIAGVDTTDKNVTIAGVTDVKSGCWYAPAAKWAYENKIVYGTTASTFDGAKAINRAEMCTLLYRYANFAKATLPENTAKVTFADDANIPTWAKEAVSKLQVAGVVVGAGKNAFSPKNNATRAEAARLISAYLDLFKKEVQYRRAV